jgi:hypothetical protein
LVTAERELQVGEFLERREISNSENHEGCHPISPGKELPLMMLFQSLQVPAPTNRNVVQSPTSCEEKNNHECDRNGFD